MAGDNSRAKTTRCLQRLTGVRVHVRVLSVAFVQATRAPALLAGLEHWYFSNNVEAATTSRPRQAGSDRVPIQVSDDGFPSHGIQQTRVYVASDGAAGSGSFVESKIHEGSSLALHPDHAPQRYR